jgi:hypothetical protein
MTNAVHEGSSRRNSIAGSMREGPHRGRSDALKAPAITTRLGQLHESLNRSPSARATAQLRIALNQRTRPARLSALSARHPVQRLVVNTGDTPLLDEVQSEKGWIVAKDIDIALLDGGLSQKIVEPDELANTGPIGTNENVYLEGHGSAGELGSADPRDVANWLHPVLPKGYRGTIYSLSCSAGVPTESLPSGVEALAENLGIPRIRLEGAAGVALNHPNLPGAHRVVKEDKYDSVAEEINKAIDEHGVNVLWKWYLQNVWTGGLHTAAAAATGFSKAFYIDITERLERLGALLPTDRDTMVVQTTIKK